MILIPQLMTVAIISKNKQNKMQEKQDLRYLSVYLSAP
jgi:hypothetical protein